SLWSWTIIFATWLRLRRVNTEADAFEDSFWSGTAPEELYESLRSRITHPFAMVFVAAMREWRRSLKAPVGPAHRIGVEDRVNKVMRVAIAREMERLEGHTGFLATVGSAAPFVGLFGTVWGIMNSFQSIALTSNTSLAVVAPGIAEALMATAFGLVAAIPAVVAYNKHATDLSRFAGRLEGFADEFSAILSRQLDERNG
ncbi:MAG: protein TolQ, partial [Rhodothalassiaceae bacterium]